MNERRDLHGLLDFVMDQLVELSGAERVVLSFLDESGIPQVSATRGQLSASGEIPAGTALMFKSVADSMRPALRQGSSSGNPEADGPIDTLDSLSVLALPLISHGQLTGLIYLDNHTIYGSFTLSDVDLLSAFANQAASAIENARLYQGLEQRVAERTAELQQANQAMEQRAAELSIINSVQQGLAAQLDFQAIIELVGDKIREVFDWHNLGIRTYDPQTNLVHYPYEVERGVRLPPFDPVPASAFSGHIIKTRKPLLINQDMDRWMEKLHSALLPGTDQSKAFLGVPIISGDRVTGVIAVEDMEREDAFDKSDVRLLTTLAASMGVALENARLFEETKRLLTETEQRAAELEIISSVEQALASKLEMQEVFDLVGDKIAEVFDAQVLIIMTYDGQADLVHYRYFIERGRRHFPEPDALGERGFAAHIIHSRQHLLFNRDLSERMKEYGSYVLAGDAPKSYMGVPLIIGDEVKGVITLQNIDREDAFSNSDLRLLNTLGTSMTVALENVRLFDETRRRAAEMAALAEIAREVSATLDLSTVLERIGARTMQLLNARTINLRLLQPDGQTLKTVVALGHHAEQFSSTLLHLGEGITGVVAQTGVPEVVNDTRSDKRTKHVPGTPVDEPTALMIVPLMTGEQIIGTMGVWRPRERGLFTEQDLEVLVSLARQTAVAIQNARLFDEVQRQKVYSEIPGAAQPGGHREHRRRRHDRVLESGGRAAFRLHRRRGHRGEYRRPARAQGIPGGGRRLQPGRAGGRADPGHHPPPAQRRQPGGCGFAWSPAVLGRKTRRGHRYLSRHHRAGAGRAGAAQPEGIPGGAGAEQPGGDHHCRPGSQRGFLEPGCGAAVWLHRRGSRRAQCGRVSGAWRDARAGRRLHPAAV